MKTKRLDPLPHNAAFWQRELRLFFFLASLGVIAGYMSINIPYTDVFIDGRWVFGFMGFALLNHWSAAFLLACVLSLSGFHQVSLGTAFVGNMLFALPTLLFVRFTHARFLTRLRSPFWYGAAWTALALLCYQLFITPLVWGFIAFLADEPIHRGVLQGWRLQPFLVESFLVAIITALAITAVRLDAARKQAELHLRTSERRFRSFMTYFPGAAYIKDEADRIIYCNRLFASMIDSTPEQLRGKTTAEYTPAEVAAHFEAENKWVFREARDLEAEHTFPGPDGPTYWLTRKFPILRDDAPMLLGAVSLDITERKQAEQALQKREEEYRLLVENQTDLIVKIDPTGRFQFVSPSYCQLFGKKEEELLGRRFAPSLLHEDDRESTLQAMEELYRPPYHITIEQRAWTEKGWRWLEWVDTAVLDDEENVTAVIGVGRDVTERKEAEATLRQLNQAVEQSPASVIITDAEGAIQYVNPKFSQVSGYSAAEAVGKNPRILKSGEHPTEFYRQMWDTITGGGEWRGEIRNKKKNGELYWELASIAGVKNSRGEITHYVAVKEDITRRKRSEEENVRQERLAAVGQLAAGIAHDFNNIMAVIILYTQLGLKTPDLPPALQDRLQTIAQQAERASELIEQILDFSRSAVLERRPINLLSFLKETVKLLERTMPENIRLDLHFGRDDYTVDADPTRVQQAVMNLAVNARDAMPHGGDLSITLSKVVETEARDCPTCGQSLRGEWVRVAVADTGSGISPEIQAHIFEPFFTTKGGGRGTGLGLAQVYGIAKQHNGHIVLQTREDGATFTLYLPALQAAQAETPALDLSPLVRGRGEVVLIVEDETTLRAALTETLQLLNYRVLAAANGREALQMLAARPEIELVLSDLVMPEMGGAALFQEMRERGLATPVVALTGHSRKNELQRLQAQGLAGWLAKPVQQKQLAQALAQALGRM